MRRVFIVQDKESALFLCPHFGDVSYTPWFSAAGRFDDYESAVETAGVHCGEGFFVESFYEA
ncbi:hypothetical protein hmeg3_19450 [Herbaspirillum sp. meg3]|nr:hypothetical protein hmeg3_19450 [Herbaspirillum sp. meg3]